MFGEDLEPEILEYLNERAAIFQFEGGYTPDEAETMALKRLEVAKRNGEFPNLAREQSAFDFDG
jgi:hypothetical protein